MRKSLRVVFAVLVIPVLAGLSRRTATHLTVLEHRLWRVSLGGQIAPFPYEFGTGYEASIQGSTGPLPSRDGHWVAYVDRRKDYDVHLLDVHTLREHRITYWGKPPTIKSVSVNVLVDGWSSDSRSLLVYVTRGEDTSEGGDLAIPKACYGFYEYDVRGGKATAVTLPKGFAFLAWLPDRSFVGTLPGRSSAIDRLVILRPGNGVETAVAGVDMAPYQARVTADGKWLVGLHANGDEGQQPRAGPAKIVKVDLATMAAKPLMALSSWSGNARPALSPDGKEVAFIRQMRMANHVPQESLFADGRQVYSCPGKIDFQWVDNRMIALACQDLVLTLDINTGRTLGQYSLTPAHSQR